MIPYLKAKPSWIFGALLILFVALRLLALLSGGMHAFEVEELYRGVIAREMISGLKMPLWDYQADHYSGGSLLTGLAAAPFFLLFGPSLFSLKLAPFLFALLTLVFLWIFMKRNFGTEAAFFAALFFILAPPSFVRLSLVAMGFHSESILFSILTLYFFYRYFYEDQKEMFLFLFGLASGLGFWFTHITIILPASCLGAWLILDPRSLFNRRNLVILSAGGFFGLVPWFLYNFTHDFEGFGFIVKNLLNSTKTVDEATPSVFRFDGVRLFLLVFEAIPMSFGFEGGRQLSRQAAGLIYYGAGVLLSLPLYVKGIKDRRVFPLLLIPLVFIAIYWLSAVEITLIPGIEYSQYFFEHCRYFIPFHFFFMMLLGIACAKSRWGKIAALILAGLGIYGFASVSFLEPWGNVLHTKGYSYVQLGALRGHIWPRHSRNFESYLKSIERYPMPERFFVLWASLHGFQFEKDLNDPEKIRKLMEAVPPEYQKYVAEGIGYGLGAQQAWRFDLEGPVMAAIPPEFRKFFYLGFITLAMTESPVDSENYPDFAARFPPEGRDTFYFVLGHFCPFERKPGGLDLVLNRRHLETEADLKSFFRGVGVRCMVNWIVEGVPFPQAVKSLGFEIPAAYQNDFYSGAGWGLRRFFAEDRLLGLARLGEIPSDARGQALAGFEACEKFYAIPE